jgi:Amidohydrolase
VGGPVQGARSQNAAERIWRRQCYTDYQTDPVGIKLVEPIGEGNIMWASQFPHPDGIWPGSQEYIQRELDPLPENTQHKIVCDNAAKLYRFVNLISAPSGAFQLGQARAAEATRRRPFSTDRRAITKPCSLRSLSFI